MPAKSNRQRMQFPSRSPLRQGALDGLCGVYSIVNALRLLCREIDRSKSEELFQVLLKSLDCKKNNAMTIACYGMSGLMLTRLLLLAIKHVQSEFGIEIILGKMPKGYRANANLETIWCELSRRMNDGGVAIIGLFGRHEHWTVALAISKKSVNLFDSDGMRVLRRAGCTTGQASRRYGVCSRNLFFLHRPRRCY